MEYKTDGVGTYCNPCPLHATIEERVSVMVVAQEKHDARINTVESMLVGYNQNICHIMETIKDIKADQKDITLSTKQDMKELRNVISEGNKALHKRISTGAMVTISVLLGFFVWYVQTGGIQ